MSQVDTYLGLVKQVKGGHVTVELSENLPSSNPIIQGKLHRLGQIGSFVRIPMGTLNLYGIVSMVGSSAVSDSESSNASVVSQAYRWIDVQLLGESYLRQSFQRGLSVYPTIDDEVHVITDSDLALLYNIDSNNHIQIGNLSASEGLPAYIDLQKLVTRHSAILGSTGSGKSNTVAAILKAVANKAYPGARIIVVDPHGEYSAALEGYATTFSINAPTNELIIPYWSLSMEELLWFLVDKRTANDTMQDMNIISTITEYREKNSDMLKSGKVDKQRVTVDSPIPFSIRDLWYKYDRLERVTYNEIARTTEALVSEGDPANLTSAVFKPPGMGNTPPFKPQPPPQMLSYMNRIEKKLKDKKYNFILNYGKYDGITHDLDDLLESWLSHDKPITILDLGGVPSDITDLVIGVLSRIVFESYFWGRHLEEFGRNRPVLLIYEEAHSYLPKSTSSNYISGYALRSVRRILKEGRKYGVGALLVSQRPSELDDTILSQCGTFISLRLSNPEDQARIKSTASDSVGSIMELLSSLRTGEAIVSGEAVGIPSRVRVPLITPRPDSDDPKVVDSWRKTVIAPPELSKAVTAWREQRPVEKKTEELTDGADASKFK